MTSRHTFAASLALVALTSLAGACGAPPPETAPGARQRGADTAYIRSAFGPTWTLVAINDAPPPPGSADRPATLVLYSGDERRASGFGGCNGWSSTWTRAGLDTLRFAPPVSTRMACATGMELEQRFLTLIERTIRYSQRDSTLTLRTATGDSARFVAR